MTKHVREAAIQNALTVDVEDYFHVTAFNDVIDSRDWSGMESRVEANTHRLLDIFDDAGVKATFFVLGWVAERQPELVRELVKRGHELACHGYSHQLIYRQDQTTFRAETKRSKTILEQTAQVPVTGYRAASYSITLKSEWALDILVECGFQYDSSIFPVRHDRYGMPGSNRWPHRLSTGRGNEIAEFPLSTAKIFGMTLPVAGGGYFRIYPYAVTRWAINSINRKEGKPFIFYLHPWEVDPDQPRIRASYLSRFRHYHNLKHTEQRLRNLLMDFKFAPVVEVMERQGLLRSHPVTVAAVAHR